MKKLNSRVAVWLVLSASLSVACGSASSTVAPTPPAVPIIDQTYEPRSVSDIGFTSTGGSAVQTFTVGVTGKLAAVDLVVNGGVGGVIAPDPCAQGVTLDVQIVSTAVDGSPSSQVLATGRLPSNMLPPRSVSAQRPINFMRVDLSPLLDVAAGNVLAFTATFSGFRCGEILGGGNGATPSTYAGGALFYQFDQNGRSSWFAVPYLDYYFRTYVLPGR